MKFHIIVLSIFLLSCTEKENPVDEFKLASLKYNLEGLTYHTEDRKARNYAIYQENKEKYKSAHIVTMTLDSLITSFNILCDSLEELPLSNKSSNKLIEYYNITLNEIALIKDKADIPIENPSLLQLDDSAFDKSLTYYCKQNIYMTALETMNYISYDMMSSCGFSFPQIEFERKGNKIEFNDRLIQQTSHKEIKLKEITKNGKTELIRNWSRTSNTFGVLYFDTLSPGDYSINGDVHMLLSNSYFRIEPFEYSFKVE